MSQKKEKYNRHMMRQYENLAKDVDYLLNHTEIMQKEIDRGLDWNRCASISEVRYLQQNSTQSLSRNQRKIERTKRRRLFGAALFLSILLSAWLLGLALAMPARSEPLSNQERVPVTELWVRTADSEQENPLLHYK